MTQELDISQARGSAARRLARWSRAADALSAQGLDPYCKADHADDDNVSDTSSVSDTSDHTVTICCIESCSEHEHYMGLREEFITEFMVNRNFDDELGEHICEQGVHIDRELGNYLSQALLLGLNDVIRGFVREYGPNVEYHNRFSSLCIDAVLTENRAALDAMARCELDVNQRRADGRTALHASVHRNPKMMRWLLAHGADTDAQSNTGRTALYDAVRGHKRRHVQLLLDAGANPDIGPAGQTPADIATGVYFDMIEGQDAGESDQSDAVAEA